VVENGSGWGCWMLVIPRVARGGLRRAAGVCRVQVLSLELAELGRPEETRVAVPDHLAAP
jgi:hypothetical protein